MTDLAKHPSEITQAAAKFLDQLKVTEKTKARYEDILWLFVESLNGESCNVITESIGKSWSREMSILKEPCDLGMGL